MQGKVTTLFKIASYALGIKADDLITDFNHCQHMLSVKDKVMMLSLGIPCSNFKTKDELSNFIMSLGALFISEIKQNRWYVFNKHCKKATRAIKSTVNVNLNTLKTE